MLDRAVGLVYMPGLDGVIRSSGLVDFVEIEPEMFWWERGALWGLHRPAWEHLRALPGAKLLHGVGFAVGGTISPPAEYLPLLRRCADELGALWGSHHLAFNWFRASGTARHTGFFLPPRQTDDGVRAAIASIRAMASALGRPFAVETGVNYLRPREDELPDGEFVARVCRGADCALLLDLHNLWANERNGRQSVGQYLAALPLERVIEVHVAGGFALDGFWLDAHSSTPPDELFDLLDEVLPRLPAARAVCFELLAPFVPSVGPDAVAGALERIRRAWDRPRGRVSSTTEVRAPAPAPAPEIVPEPSAAAWEEALGALVIGGAPRSPLEHELLQDPAVPLLRKLVAQGRAGTITDGLPTTTRLLVLALGPDATLALFRQFWSVAAPQPFASTESEAFAAWLGGQDRVEPFLDDAVRFDLAASRAESTGEPVEVTLSIDPRALCEALVQGRLPAPAEARVVATVQPSGARRPDALT